MTYVIHSSKQLRIKMIWSEAGQPGPETEYLGGQLSETTPHAEGSKSSIIRSSDNTAFN